MLMDFPPPFLHEQPLFPMAVMIPFWYFRLFLFSYSPDDACSHTKRMQRRLLNTVQFAESGLLIRGQTSEEAFEVGDHAFVCLDDLLRVSVNASLSGSGKLTFWNATRKSV
jgi:hypothetical protein